VRALAGLVAAALVGRLYGPAVLGAFSVALLVVACLTPLAALGTDLLSLDAAARSRPGRGGGDGDVGALAVLATIGSLTVAIACLLTAWMVGALGGGATSVLIRSALIYTALQLPAYNPGAALLFAVQGKGNLLPKIVTLHILGPAFRAALLGVASVMGWGPWVVAISFPATGALALLGGLVAFKRTMQINPGHLFRRGILSLSRHHVLRGWQVGTAATFGVGLGAFDTISLGLVADPAAVGVYAALSRILSVGQILHTAGSNILYPRLSRALATPDSEYGPRITSQFAAVLAIGSGLAYGIMGGMGDRIVTAVYGAEFRIDPVVAVVVALGTLSIWMTAYVGYALVVLDRAKWERIAVLGGVMLGVGIIVGSGARLGGLAAALGVLAAGTFSTLIRLAKVSREPAWMGRVAARSYGTALVAFSSTVVVCKLLLAKP